MASRKKSRKGGPIGVAKSTIPVKRQPSERVRKHKGNKPGSRFNTEVTKEKAASKSPQDPRVGSKTPIDLFRHKQTSVSTPSKKYHSPKQELDAIENDARLQRLLDKQENKTLTKLEQDYVNNQLNRHAVLCDLLGISIEDEQAEESDPLDSLNAISMDDYKN